MSTILCCFLMILEEEVVKKSKNTVYKFNNYTLFQKRINSSGDRFSFGGTHTRIRAFTWCHDEHTHSARQFVVTHIHPVPKSTAIIYHLFTLALLVYRAIRDLHTTKFF